VRIGFITERKPNEKKYVAGIFSRAASTYDQVGPPFFSYFGRRLVELARIPNGTTVLDVATGRGAILFPAAEQVGSCGRVVGVDLSTGMLRELAAQVERSNLGHAEICQMDAESLAFSSASFDFVFCGHSVYYFPCAVREFYRVLKTGGQVGVTIVARGCSDWLWEALGSYVPAQDSGADDEGEKESNLLLDTPNGLEGLLSEAGFESIRVIEEEADFVYVNEEEWWATMWTLGLRGTMEEMGATTLERFKREIFERIQAFMQPDGFHIPFRVLCTLGVKAS
jgi:ubiquinone/menaquinone biosynthesis C-methylase UbiE